jgi:hypothetical protein
MSSKLTEKTIEGTWDEIVGHADEFNGHKLRLTILPDEPVKKSTYIYEGMFPQLLDITDEDIKAAEFHGDPDDGLDWSE